MKLDLFGWRIIIVKLPIEVKHEGVRGPARDLHRRIVWENHLKDKMAVQHNKPGKSLAEFVRPLIKAGQKDALIIRNVKAACIGRPLADERELDKRIGKTIRAERSRMG